MAGLLSDSAATGDAVFAAQLHLSGLEAQGGWPGRRKGTGSFRAAKMGTWTAVDVSGRERSEILLLMTDKPFGLLAWSPDNKWIAAVGEEGRAWIWSTNFLQSFSETKETTKPRTNAHPVHAKHTSSPHRHRMEKSHTLDWLRIFKKE